MFASRTFHFQSGSPISGTSDDRPWSSFLEIGRIEHPDDAIVKIMVRTFPGIAFARLVVTDIWGLSKHSLRGYVGVISMFTEDTMLSQKCMSPFDQKDLKVHR